MYYNGKGVPQDWSKAREWYEKAAEKGNAEAMFNLGVMYEHGEGVPQNYAKAAEWYEKWAEKGDAKAMFRLGWMYANGKGVRQDWSKAWEWYKKAVEQRKKQENDGVAYTVISIVVFIIVGLVIVDFLRGC